MARAGLLPSRGTLWMVGAALSFALMAASAKALGPAIPAVEKVFWRSLVMVAATLLMMRAARVPLRPASPGLLLVRSVVGFAAITCYFAAIVRLPLANAVTLQNTNSIFAGVIAALVFREGLRGKQVLATLACFAGVFLIFRPQPEAPLVGSAIGLASGVLSGGAYATVRRLNATEHPFMIALAFPTVCVPLALAVSLPGFVWPAGMEWFWLLLIGLFTQAGQICLIHALRRHSTARAAQVGYLSAVFSVGLGLWLGDRFPSWNVILGIAVIIVALALYRPPEEPTRTPDARPAS